MPWKAVHFPQNSISSEELMSLETFEEFDGDPAELFPISSKNESIKKSTKRKQKTLESIIDKKKSRKSKTPKVVETWTPQGNNNAPITDSTVQFESLMVSGVLLPKLQKIGICFPTEVQQLVIPSAISKKDIIAAAQTGSGKTLAFALPILSNLLKKSNRDKKSPKALILLPTRELAIQVKNHFANVIDDLTIKYCVLVGGMSLERQVRVLKSKPEVIIATPGRLWQLIEQRFCNHILAINSIDVLVLDEADRLCETMHFLEMSKILDYIYSSRDPSLAHIQTMVFSATLSFVPSSKRSSKSKSPYDKLMKKLKFSTKPKIVDITSKKLTADNLVEHKVLCDASEKDIYLYYILLTIPGRCLVFVNSINIVRRCSSIFSNLGFQCFPLHAGLRQQKRLQNLERFASLSNSVLFASDVAARGLDIKKVDHVIHYHVPRTSQTYIHRSGRTARAYNTGATYTLLSPSEMTLYAKLCRAMSRDLNQIDRLSVNNSVLDRLKLRVEVAQAIEHAEFKLGKHGREEAWLTKAAEEMELDLTEDCFSKSVSGNKELDKLKNQLSQWKKQLKKLLDKKLLLN